MKLQFKEDIIAYQYNGSELSKDNISKLIDGYVIDYTTIDETLIPKKDIYTIECRQFYTNKDGLKSFLRSFTMSLNDWIVYLPEQRLKGLPNYIIYNDKDFNETFKYM